MLAGGGHVPSGRGPDMDTRRFAYADPPARGGKCRLSADSYRHPLVFFADGIGDHLMVLPALRALAALFKDRLSVICRPDVAAAAFGGLPVAHVVVDDFSGEGRALHRSAASAANAASRCDLFLSLNNWRPRTQQAIARHFHRQWRVGFDEGCGTRLPNILAEHVIDRAFRVPQAFNPGLKVDDFAAPPIVPERDLRRAAAVIKETFATQRPLLVIHPETMPEKRIALRCWAGALDLFRQQKRHWKILILSQHRHEWDLGNSTGEMAVRSGLPLGSALALVGAANLFAGVDSSLLHAADLYRVAGVGLFGPTEPGRWGFRFAPHHHFVVPKHDWPAIDVRKLAEILCRMATLSDARRVGAVTSLAPGGRLQPGWPGRITHARLMPRTGRGPGPRAGA
jgi:ADP-heptose:LPS heptosyltransferase